MRNIIGIRREDKNEWERRVPLVPEDVKALVRDEGISFVVQPSRRRAFPDSAFAHAGASVSEDLTGCGVVLGVKEMPASAFRDGGAFVFFAHVIKGQSYNMAMLRDLMAKKCHLIDYEKVEDGSGRRLIFFGRHAGLAGMIDTLWALGKRLAWEGKPNLFEGIKQAHRYGDLSEAEIAVGEAGAEIRKSGFPPDLVPLVFGFAGYGNVSKGAQEILDALPVIEIEPDSVPGPGEGSANAVYKVVFREEDMVERTDPGKPFALDEYYEHPERYGPRFASFLPKLTVLVNAVYWDDRYPRLVTKAGLKKLLDRDGRAKLKVIGDISCDVEGAVEATVRATDPGNPAFVFDPETSLAKDGVEGRGVVILSVDNLPAELPVEASRDFSAVLKPFVPALAKADFTMEKPAIPDPLKRALIVHSGELTPGFRYLEKLVQDG